jgi:hypothetical protein
LRGVRSTTKQSRTTSSGLLRGACTRTARSADPGARNDSPCKVGEGALLGPSAWAKSCAPIAREGGRERPDDAHAATIRQTILPTLGRADEVIE